MLSSRSMTPANPPIQELGGVRKAFPSYPSIVVRGRMRCSDITLPKDQTSQTRFRCLSSSSSKEISLNYNEKWDRNRIAGQPQEVGLVSHCPSAALPKWTKDNPSVSISCCAMVLLCAHEHPKHLICAS